MRLGSIQIINNLTSNVEEDVKKPIVTVEMWNQIGENLVNPLFEDPFHSVRVCASLIYSNIQPHIFTSLKVKKKFIS